MAFKVFLKVSTWIVVPIILALYVGKFLDSYYNTGQLLFYICISASFIITMIGIVKVSKDYSKNVTKIEQDGTRNNKT